MRIGHPIQQTMEQIHEVDEHAPANQEPASNINDDHTKFPDATSVISKESTTYSPELRDEVTVGLAHAIMKQLPPSLTCATPIKYSERFLASHLMSIVEEFAESAKTESLNEVHLKGLRMVRRMKKDIADKFQDEIRRQSQQQNTVRQPVIAVGSQPQMSFQEKVNVWCMEADPNEMNEHGMGIPATQEEINQISPDAPPESVVSTFEGSLQDSDGSLAMYEPMSPEAGPIIPSTGKPWTIDPTTILHHFTQQNSSSFKALVQKTERLLERYHGRKMELIQQRTSEALSWYASDYKEGGRPFKAQFNIDWDLRGFLESNYDDGTQQDLNLILAATGGIGEAKLCSVAEFMRWQWPACKRELIDAIHGVLRKNDSRPASRHCKWLKFYSKYGEYLGA